MQLDQLCLFPIKSVAGIHLDRAELGPTGLHFDRQFMLVDTQGRFLTGRRFPQLVQVHAALQPEGLMVHAPTMPPLAIRYRELRDAYQAVTVWGSTLQAQRGIPAWDHWFSRYLNTACRLVFFGEQSHRLTKRGQQPVAFADGYPLLLASRDSLADLNRRLPQPVSMNRFRANLIISGALPFAEDGWQRIRIGEIEFEVVKPCSRCVFTTVDPQTGRPDDALQPLATLKRFRRNPEGEVDFGMNLIARGTGLLQAGDPIEVLQTRPPVHYPDNAPYLSQPDVSDQQLAGESPLPPSPDEEEPMKSVQLLFDDLDTLVAGNDQQTILEQAEQAGLELPYSCRAGTCGSCRMKLIAGEVEVLEDAGLSREELDDGQILTCSCIPKSDVVLNQV